MRVLKVMVRWAGAWRTVGDNSTTTPTNPGGGGGFGGPFGKSFGG